MAEQKRFTAQDGTSFDTTYRDEEVDLYVAGDNTIIAKPSPAAAASEGDTDAADE